MCCCTWLEQSGGDLTDINSSETSPQCGLAVTADDFGKVKLFNTPCIKWDAPYCTWKDAVFCVCPVGCWSKRANVVFFFFFPASWTCKTCIVDTAVILQIACGTATVQE